MADPSRAPSARSAGYALALAVGMGLGLLPHLYVLDLAPVSRDDVVWITRGAASHPGWASWVFASEHFVGFRPVTALSYTIDSLAGGLAPWPYRVTDLGLHVVAAGLLFVVFRALVPSLSRVGGLVASAVLLVHPVSGLVVPHLARRAYPLATSLGLLGLLVLLGRPSRARPWLAAALLGAAALANEAAYVGFLVAGLLVVSREPDRRAAVRTLAPAFGLAVLLVVHRLVLLGGAGGYAVERGARWAEIVAATWNGLLGIEVLRPGVAPLPGGFALLAVPALIVGLGAVSLRPFDAVGRSSAVLWAWVAALTLIYAPQGVFFPRQLYVALAPFALLVGIAVARLPAARGAVRAVGVAVVVVLGALWLRQSPVLLGADPLQAATWRAHDALVRDLVADLGHLPAGTRVDAVIPFHPRPETEALRARDDEEARRGGRQALHWVTARTGIRFGAATLVTVDPLAPAPVGQLDETSGRPVVRLGPGVVVTSPGDARIEDAPGGTVIHPVGEAPWLYFHDGVDGRLVPRAEPR